MASPQRPNVQVFTSWSSVIRYARPQKFGNRSCWCGDSDVRACVEQVPGPLPSLSASLLPRSLAEYAVRPSRRVSRARRKQVRTSLWICCGDGTGVGTCVGSTVRHKEGTGVGTGVGAGVGKGDGAGDGLRVGTSVGIGVGTEVGIRVGTGVGTWVGTGEGLRVSSGVGT